MTTDLKVKLLNEMMDLRQDLQNLQVRMSELTAILSGSDFPEPPALHLSHSFAPPPDGVAIHDEPPSRPLPVE